MANQPTPHAENTPPKTELSNSLMHAAIIIIVGVFATTLAQPQVLGRLPLQNLLKNELHVNQTMNASFFFLAGLPWYFKPFAGIFTDAFPIFQTRRYHYILISTILAVLGWVGLASAPHQYNTLLYFVIGINVFMVIASTVVGGYMVETAQATGGSGRLTAVRQFVQNTGSIIQGPTAGYLASIPIAITGYACGGVMFLLVPATVLFLHEQRRRQSSTEVLANAGRQLKNIGSAGTMWAAAGLMALFYIAPGLSTATMYRQQNLLHMSTQQQGNLGVPAGIAGILAAVLYGFLCKKINLRDLLVLGITAGTIANLGYLFYTTQTNAVVIETINGFGYILAECVLMDLAVRATPKGSEGLGFSLQMSIRNLALFGTDIIGSKMMDDWHLKYETLVISNAVTTAIAIPLVFLLPKMILMKPDQAPVIMDISEPAPEMA